MRLTLFFTRGVSLATWEQGGMFEREVSLYRRLAGRGVEVTFVTYGDAADRDFGGRLAGVRVLCNRLGLAARTYERLLPVLHARWLWRSDVIKTNQINGAEVALRAARLWGKPLVARSGYLLSEFAARQHGEDSPEAASAGDLERRVFAAARWIVVTTPAMAAEVAQRIPEAADRTTVVPNYVDTDRFAPAAAGERDIDVVFVGRIEPQKNLDALLAAVSGLAVKLAIVGSGSLRAELAERYAGLGERLRWSDPIPHPRLPDLLNRAKLFVLPSHYEGHPKTLLEAMACALPVIGADSPGIREVIRHRESGWLCGGDAESIRRAIVALLEQPELARRLGENARRQVVASCSLDRIVEIELSVLAAAAGLQRPAPVAAKAAGAR